MRLLLYLLLCSNLLLINSDPSAYTDWSEGSSGSSNSPNNESSQRNYNSTPSQSQTPTADTNSTSDEPITFPTVTRSSSNSNSSESASDCEVQCGVNEVSLTCGPGCGEKTCINFDSTCHYCDRECARGCFCKSDYVRSLNGTCILISDCPPRVCHRPFEYFDECPRACPPQYCSYKQTNEHCSPTVCCEPKCQCEHGFLRNAHGFCIPASQCPSPPRVCGINEKYSDCYKDSDPTCRTRLRPDHRYYHPDCKMGCICSAGHLRHDNGTCVPVDECSTPACGANEVYNKCGSACEAHCYDYNSNNNNNLCSTQCVEGCFCKKGFVRTWNGDCIPSQSCPKPQKCGPNEEYSKCKIHYSQLCSRLWSSNTHKEPYCSEPGCNCKDGYLRNGTVYDECIFISHCHRPGTPYPNKEPFPKRENDPPTQIPRPILPQPPTKPTSPWPPVWIFLPKNPPAPQQPIRPKPNPACGCNEVATDCYNPNAKNCSTRIRSSGQVCDEECRPGCDCKDGYLRHDNGTCVPYWECSPAKCNLNEVSLACGSACEDTCDDYDNTCRVCTLQCIDGCFCRPGYVRAKDGSCISPEECPPRICTKPNEYFDYCPVNCPPQYCSIAESFYDCSYSPTCCHPQCRCVAGFKRDASGTCIPEDECPECPKPNECGPNEVWDHCKVDCPLNTCDILFNGYACAAVAETCTPGCDCINGYYRNGTVDDPCIPKNECKPLPPSPPQKCGVYEEQTICNNECLTTCKTRFQPNKDCTVDCKTRGCKCFDNYLRHDNGTCVPINECSPADCNDGEVWEACGPVHEVNCFNYGKSYNDHRNQCKDGCFCKPGTIRTEYGSCVTPEQCPRKPQEPECPCTNEIFVDCKACDQSCKNRFRPGQISCTAVCIPGCQCKEGYLRHDNNTCVPVEQCSPPECGENEYHPECGPSCEDTCSSLNNTCRVCAEQCIDGCYCREGFVRADNGTCIRKELCPIPTCPGQNEHYELCPKICPTQNCATRNQEPNCTGIVDCCKPQCWCEEGYYRNHNGDCVLECYC